MTVMAAGMHNPRLCDRRKKDPVCSSICSASMSALRAVVGPGKAPESSAITPFPPTPSRISNPPMSSSSLTTLTAVSFSFPDVSGCLWNSLLSCLKCSSMAFADSATVIFHRLLHLSVLCPSCPLSDRRFPFFPVCIGKDLCRNRALIWFSLRSLLKFLPDMVGFFSVSSFPQLCIKSILQLVALDLVISIEPVDFFSRFPWSASYPGASARTRQDPAHNFPWLSPIAV